MAAMQRPISLKSFSGVPTTAAWPSKPSFYIVSANDRTLSPELQSWMAERMGAKVFCVLASHMSLISHADVVTDTIGRAAYWPPSLI